MDELARGIDVGAKFEVYSLMAELAQEGKCIVMILSEMPECQRAGNVGGGVCRCL